METYNILDLFKECVSNMPKEIYDEFSYWCLGKNDADVLDISLTLDDYLKKIESIFNGTYDKEYSYVYFMPLNRQYDGLFKEYWPTDYDNVFKYRMREFEFYSNNFSRTSNVLPFTFFLNKVNNPKSKPTLKFNNLRANCSMILVLNDRFNGFGDFCLLKTAAFWTEFFRSKIEKLGNNYSFMFNFKNKNTIYTFDGYLPDHKELKKYKLRKYSKEIINNMIYVKD